MPFAAATPHLLTQKARNHALGLNVAITASCDRDPITIHYNERMNGCIYIYTQVRIKPRIFVGREDTAVLRSFATARSIISIEGISRNHASQEVNDVTYADLTPRARRRSDYLQPYSLIKRIATPRFADDPSRVRNRPP